MTPNKDNPLEAGVTERDLEKAREIGIWSSRHRFLTDYDYREWITKNVAQALSEERERAGRKYRVAFQKIRDHGENCSGDCDMPYEVASEMLGDREEGKRE